MSDEMKNQNTDENNSVNSSQNNGVDDFDYLLGENGFEIPNDDLYENETDESTPSRRKSEKSQRRRNGAKKSIKTVIWIIVIFAISILLALTILLLASEFLGIGLNRGNQCVVEIEKGVGTAKIAAELKEQGAISSELLFRLYSKVTGKDGTYQYGVYTFKNELGYGEIAEMLQAEGAVAQSVKVTIPEQASMDDIMKILEESGVCTKSDFRNAVKNGKYDYDFVAEIPVSEVHYKFEGYLFPDTYEFYNYDSAECAELAIRKMLQNLDNKLTEEVREQIKQSGYTIHEVLTMASVVELEASASTKDMPKVAAVFYNRLKWDEPKKLGSSPTMDYPFGDGKYDTNVNEGLPPGPLCAPSEKAILAAANPTKDFTATYFVTDSDMNFYYNNSLAAHNQTIQNLKKQGKWLG